MSKKDNLSMLKALFEKKHVLEIKDLCQALNCTSRVTAFRYLCDLNYLTSYTHNGKFYTLPEIAQFDKDGFWHFGDIGFSSYGTLMNTLTHIITMSESGKTNSELEKQFRIKVQNSLQKLLKPNIIAKAKQVKPCLYVNSNPMISDQQIQNRTKIGNRRRLPDWIIAEILVETVLSFPIHPNIDDVVKRLSKRGSLITYEQVKQVFEENNLEKKTLD
jgi:hypothetical protein